MPVVFRDANKKKKKKKEDDMNHLFLIFPVFSFKARPFVHSPSGTDTASGRCGINGPSWTSSLPVPRFSVRLQKENPWMLKHRLVRSPSLPGVQSSCQLPTSPVSPGAVESEVEFVSLAYKEECT